MLKPFSSFACSLTLMTVASFTHADILSVHCPLGCPTNPTKNDLVFGHVYALSNDPDTKFADWVAYEVDVLNFGDSPGRKWKKDPLLDDDETLEPSDYGSLQKALGADRGHQAPLASFAGSQYWSELNYLSNITPQDSDLNQGPWKSLEDAVRDAVGYRNSLFVITGPLYDGSTLQLPKADEPHKIPTAYFKVVYDLEGNSASFVMKQSAQRDDNFCDNHVTFNDVQGKTAFKLPKLTDNAAVLKRLGC